MPTVRQDLHQFLDRAAVEFGRGLDRFVPTLTQEEFGVVTYVGPGVARVQGLPGVRNEEIVQFDSGSLGLIFNLDVEQLGVVMLSDVRNVQAGDRVVRTGRVMDVPVGPALLGRVVSAVGEPLDELGALRTTERRPIERAAPPILHRAPVNVPLATGWKVLDALVADLGAGNES